MITHMDGNYSPYYNGTDDLKRRLRELLRDGWIQASSPDLETAVGDALTWLENHPGASW